MVTSGAEPAEVQMLKSGVAQMILAQEPAIEEPERTWAARLPRRPDHPAVPLDTWRDALTRQPDDVKVTVDLTD